MQPAWRLQDLNVGRPAEPIPLPTQPPTTPWTVEESSSSWTTAPWGSMDDDDDGSCRAELQEFPVFIHPDLTIRLLQAPSAFFGLEHDDTGRVVWGASVCLARYLSPAWIRDRTVLELGCGCGLPSLVAATYGAARVVASDREDATLEQLDRVVRHNNPNLNHERSLELVQLDWKQHDGNAFLEKADIVLASDVIYHQDMVPALVQTIDRYMEKGGKAYLALRNTRQGVATFWQEAMPAAGFQVVESISCQEYLKESDIANNDDVNAHRFRGDHTIYVFQRESEVAS